MSGKSSRQAIYKLKPKNEGRVFQVYKEGEGKTTCVKTGTASGNMAGSPGVSIAGHKREKGKCDGLCPGSR